MRIAIREQLGLLILLASLIGLAVVSFSTWISNRHFVLSIGSQRLALIASLKAAQLASDINLMQTAVNFITNRVTIQDTLHAYNNNSVLPVQWITAEHDMRSAIGGAGSLGSALTLQAKLFPKNATGTNGPYSLLNVTSQHLGHSLELPFTCPNGSPAYLGTPWEECDSLGYPPALYPNLTYVAGQTNGIDIQQAEYDGFLLGPGGAPALILGPWKLNDSLSLMSITVPVSHDSDSNLVLAWLTAVMNARLILGVLNESEDLGETGEAMLVGPASRANFFPQGIVQGNRTVNSPTDFDVRLVVAPPSASGGISDTQPFPVSDYPVLREAITVGTGAVGNAGAVLKARTETGRRVSVGFAMPRVPFVHWTIMVIQSRGGVWAQIHKLRDILIACTFTTAGLMAVIAFPLAHFGSLPIRNLRDATTKSVRPLPAQFSRTSLDSDDSDDAAPVMEQTGVATAAGVARDGGVRNPVVRYRLKRRGEREAKRRAPFQIPGKVQERKHLFKDELSDLTSVFNQMSDELTMQYERLEERVRRRTAALEQSKRAAEVANESKTLFIANISHELKTPLNGIMGMAAVCLHDEDDDPVRLRHSLRIIYKSGDLLLHLLNDLLTFTKNSAGDAGAGRKILALDERAFALADVASQTLALFEKQACESNIRLTVHWDDADPVPVPADDAAAAAAVPDAPPGPVQPRLKDMILWGDLQRILQIMINLVSNSLKFTPPGGEITLRIRRLPDPAEPAEPSPPSPPALPPRPPSLLSTPLTPGPADAPTLHLEFRVRDTGTGIAAHMQTQIFQPFVQGDRGLARKHGGTGLGLAICAQLAALLRGEIGLESKPGEGAAFTVTVPLRWVREAGGAEVGEPGGEPRGSLDDPPPAARALGLVGLGGDGDGDDDARTCPALSPAPLLADAADPLVSAASPDLRTPSATTTPLATPTTPATPLSPPAPRPRIRVLVADDNAVNQEVVLRMLRLEHVVDVVLAADGEEAFRAVRDSMGDGDGDGDGNGNEEGNGTHGRHAGFDLILMDVQMPRVDGLQSTRWIRDLGFRGPIVALTAFAEESNVRACRDAGMDFFLSKPIRRPQLRKVLLEFCRAGQAVPVPVPVAGG